MKRILLIEDNEYHISETERVLSKLSDMYQIKSEYFEFLKQNADKREDQKRRIKEYLLNTNSDGFDILMIDILLGGDYRNPIGIEIIEECKPIFIGKYIIAYTEMPPENENYNRMQKMGIHIVAKPNFEDSSKASTECLDEYKGLIKMCVSHNLRKQ